MALRRRRSRHSVSASRSTSVLLLGVLNAACADRCHDEGHALTPPSENRVYGVTASERDASLAAARGSDEDIASPGDLAATVDERVGLLRVRTRHAALADVVFDASDRREAVAAAVARLLTPAAPPFRAFEVYGGEPFLQNTRIRTSLGAGRRDGGLAGRQFALLLRDEGEVTPVAIENAVRADRANVSALLVLRYLLGRDDVPLAQEGNKRVFDPVRHDAFTKLGRGPQHPSWHWLLDAGQVDRVFLTKLTEVDDARLAHLVDTAGTVIPVSEELRTILLERKADLIPVL